MAAIPEAVEGMQLSQRFSGAAQQLQAEMDALELSLETNDFGKQHATDVKSCVALYEAKYSTLSLSAFVANSV